MKKKKKKTELLIVMASNNTVHFTVLPKDTIGDTKHYSMQIMLENECHLPEVISLDKTCHQSKTRIACFFLTSFSIKIHGTNFAIVPLLATRQILSVCVS